MTQAIEAAARATAAESGLQLELEDAMRLPVSGAGHDACNIAKVAPAGMIFVPCADGISHAEIESATPDDCAAGCAVLLSAVVERADDV